MNENEKKAADVILLAIQRQTDDGICSLANAYRNLMEGILHRIGVEQIIPQIKQPAND